MACSTTSDARAERGEAAMKLFSGHELALLKHPEASYVNASSAKVYLPRFGLALRYGLSNALWLGIGFDVAIARSVSAYDVRFQGFTGKLVADYADVVLPLSITYDLNRGTSWRALLSVSGGTALYRWREDQMLNATGVTQYPVHGRHNWRHAWHGAMHVGIEFRPWDHWSAAVAGYVAKKGRDVHIGLRVIGTVLMSLGWPQFGS